ncbi:hypothetical protein [Okeania sp. SIO2B3]|uniref:hypothetical protein n=1 Tax=Okeania sp. SIO2B3 TaxID=2607784 RepID=UPI0013C12AE9|nr:hypothetical protein [Okeania sp. SIO2B3]NET41182.1 hypothetical protein [Okeania sp. SIO2B3]
MKKEEGRRKKEEEKRKKKKGRRKKWMGTQTLSNCKHCVDSEVLYQFEKRILRIISAIELPSADAAERFCKKCPFDKKENL